jgi:hypothetical protein
MSALPPKADIGRRELNVRFVPIAEVASVRSVELAGCHKLRCDSCTLPAALVKIDCAPQATSALGQKQTSAWRWLMSALPPKADIARERWDVRFVPKTDIMQSLSITSGEYAPLRQLFVVRDATALSADARLKGLLDGGLTCLWEIKVHRNEISFRRTLDCIERSLAYRIVANLKGADISP